MANTYPTGVRTQTGIHYSSVVVTNDAATTAVIPYCGFRRGCIENHTGAAQTITWFGAMTPDGTAHACLDDTATAAAIVTTIAADHQIHQLPEALSGVPYLFPKGSNASVTLAIHLEE